MKGALKVVGSILLALVLSIVIFFEIRFIINVVDNSMLTKTQLSISSAVTEGDNAATITELHVYDEIPFEYTKGDVIALDDYDVNIKVSGRLTKNNEEQTSTDYLSFSYAEYKNKDVNTLVITRKQSEDSVLRKAFSNYWIGKGNDLCAIAGQKGDVQLLQQSFVDGNIPVIYNKTENMYYIYILLEDATFLEISSTDPAIITKEIPTIHFDDPQQNPMTAYVYNEYELAAITNTINEILASDMPDVDEDSNPSAVDYDDSDWEDVSDESTSSSTPQPSPSNPAVTDDLQKRTDMLSLVDFTWDGDGNSTQTNAHVDITSDDAMRSQWILTSTAPYSYSNNGLQISNLSATRTMSDFRITGNINNITDQDHPFVMIIKYLDENTKLLGISAVDRRSNAIPQNGVTTFDVTITPVSDHIDIQKITSVMFEVY